MIMDFRIGDIIILKKKHPCGSDKWQITRIGADIGIVCLGCKHRVMLERRVFEKRVKTFVSRGE